MRRVERSNAACNAWVVTSRRLRPRADRPIAFNAGKLESEIGCRSDVGFDDGIGRTVHWYLDHEEWWRDITSGAYKAWIDKNYGFRIAV